MKKFLLIGLMLVASGCATSAQKATSYCDNNWQGRFDNYQACYDRMYQASEDKRKALSHAFDGMGQKVYRCTTEGNETTCQ